MKRFTLAAVCLAASLGAAQAQDVQTGEALFQSYCAGCHGVDATGEGPLAPLLTVPVSDLTTLAARSGGEFPLIRVVELIDGRQLLQGHGGPMPVFGPMLGGGSAVLDGPEGSVVQTRGDVVRIAEYLMSLQGG
ncbi:c-type cytochrome [Psychromarinibacter sp. S121]|uniref:c-type cytochrome n=1 Tax=Psychromarinibacter sp. S121 TaxID=3415127 RepID=UPI003C7A52A6